MRARSSVSLNATSKALYFLSSNTKWLQIISTKKQHRVHHLSLMETKMREEVILEPKIFSKIRSSTCLLLINHLKPTKTSSNKIKWWPRGLHQTYTILLDKIQKLMDVGTQICCSIMLLDLNRMPSIWQSKIFK